MFGIDSFNSTPILPVLNMPSHNFTLKSENKKTFNAKTEDELLTGYSPVTDENGDAYSLYGIMDNYCDDKFGGSDAVEEICSDGPFTQFTIRGTSGTASDNSDARFYFDGLNKLVLKDYDNSSKNSGAVEIDVRRGYAVKLNISLANANHGKDFKEDEWTNLTTAKDGVLSKTDLSTTVLMTGGDKLSIDIDSDWGGTTKFYIKVQGNPIADASNIINDTVTVELLGVYKLDGGSGGGSGGGNDDGNDDGNGSDDSTEDTTADGGMGFGTIALLGIAGIGAFVLLR